MLKQEKIEKEFQEQIAKELSIQRENLKQKDIILRDKEKELEYREKQKEVVFNLLDNAQSLISQGKYDEALNVYREVTNTFAQLQWVDEIPIIGRGISCTSANEAYVGENWAASQDSWFSYTADKYQVVNIKSCHQNQENKSNESMLEYGAYDTWLWVFRSCKGDLSLEDNRDNRNPNLIAQNDDLPWDKCNLNWTSSGVQFPMLMHLKRCRRSLEALTSICGRLQMVRLYIQHAKLWVIYQLQLSFPISLARI